MPTKVDPVTGKRNKSGGRKKGVPNRINQMSAAVHKAAMERVDELFRHAGTKTPLEFLISVYADDKNDMSERVSAARTAADYIHQKQSRAVEISGPDEGAIQLELVSQDAHNLLTEMLFEDDSELSKE